MAFSCCGLVCEIGISLTTYYRRRTLDCGSQTLRRSRTGDLVGKHNRVRTVPMPTWTKVAIDAWTGPAGVVDGYLFRPVKRGDKVQGDVLSEKVVWQMLKPYAKAAGVAGIAPHDCRRSCAKLCRAAGAELEQIQLLLGHASVQTTGRYLGTKQDLVHAPNDGIKLRVAV